MVWLFALMLGDVAVAYKRLLDVEPYFLGNVHLKGFVNSLA